MHGTSSMTTLSAGGAKLNTTPNFPTGALEQMLDSCNSAEMSPKNSLKSDHLVASCAGCDSVCVIVCVCVSEVLLSGSQSDS